MYRPERNAEAVKRFAVCSQRSFYAWRKRLQEKGASAVRLVERRVRRRPNYDNIFVMSPAPVGKFSAVIALLIIAIPVSAQRAVVHEKDIVKAIVDQFDKSDLVGLGELHGSQADQDLRFQIIHNKAFARKVRIIAVEGLNAFYQEDLDRYIRGEDVPLEQVQKVWRDSTGIFIGPVIRTTYQQFLGEVRSVNRGLPDRTEASGHRRRPAPRLGQSAVDRGFPRPSWASASSSAWT